MTVRFHANNYSTTLYASIADSDTSLVVTSATGLPTITSGQVYRLTLVNGAEYEIVEVTAASGSTLTITRAVEGTTAVAWSAGAIIQLRTTADSHDRKVDIPSSVTSGKILKSNGTVYTSSTETYAVPGTSGNVMTSDGTNWTSAAPSGGGGITMNTASGATQALAVNNGYVCTNASQCVGTLPATAAIGSFVKMVSQGAGGIQMVANTGQTIKGLGSTSTSGGSVTPAAQYDSITAVCIVADTTWSIDSFVSSLLTFA